jgi:hypothetical protein
LKWAHEITFIKENIRHAKNVPAFPVGGAAAGFHPGQRIE